MLVNAVCADFFLATSVVVVEERPDLAEAVTVAAATVAAATVAAATVVVATVVDLAATAADLAAMDSVRRSVR